MLHYIHIYYFLVPELKELSRIYIPRGRFLCSQWPLLGILYVQERCKSNYVLLAQVIHFKGGLESINSNTCGGKKSNKGTMVIWALKLRRKDGWKWLY